LLKSILLFVGRRKGASAVEYGVVVGLVSLVAIGSVLRVAQEVEGLLLSAETEISTNITERGEAMVLLYNAANGSVTLPLEGAVDVEIDWGDYHANKNCPRRIVFSGVGDNGDTTCVYAEPGNYRVIVKGSVDRFGSRSAPQQDIENLVAVQDWGNLGLTSLENAFYGAINLQEVPDYLPTGITRLSSTFRDAAAFDDDIGGWDTSAVTHMDYMFRGADGFNKPIDSWDVSSVEYMQKMFRYARSFNQDLNSWTVASVRSMNQMFYGAEAFNGNVSDWILSPLNTNFNMMFREAKNFNGDVTQWNVSNVSNFDQMFQDAWSFDQDLSGWCVSSASTYTDFALNAPISSNGKEPAWGTCPP
jgi:surface protein